jgi:ABC-2 type transport system permease protein
MSVSVRRLLHVTRFAVLRMLRDPVGMIILLGIPLPLIPILGAIFSKIPADGSFLKGARDMMTFVATGMIVMFQLFSGRYSVDAARESLLSVRKWRIHAAPCAPGTHVTGILAAGTMISMAQGFLLVAFTRVFLGVRWGSLGIVVLVMLGTALLAQIVNIALLLLTRNVGAAATLGWVFAWGSAALGGLIFPLPADRPFWRFMVTWGTPYSLAQTAVLEAAGGARAAAAACIGVLFGLSAVLGLVVSLLGRRRLA